MIAKALAEVNIFANKTGLLPNCICRNLYILRIGGHRGIGLFPALILSRNKSEGLVRINPLALQIIAS